MASFIFCLPGYAAGRAECRALHSKILARDVPYCALLPPSYDAEKQRRYPALYFLHGLGENEQTLIDSGGMSLIDDLRAQGQLGEFLVVAPEGGSSFYMNSRDGRVRYEDFFIREFLPFVEKNYRVRAGRSFRGLSGVSMGGFGSLRLAFRYPDLFGSASAHSAALMEKAPGGNIAGQQQELLTRVLGGVFGSPIDPVFWKQTSPFTLVRNGSRPAGLKIYFDCGTEDEFGFDAGARAFHKLLASRGIAHEFHLYPGGHGWSFVAQHFAASLQFHSRAFGLGPAATR